MRMPSALAAGASSMLGLLLLLALFQVGLGGEAGLEGTLPVITAHPHGSDDANASIVCKEAWVELAHKSPGMLAMMIDATGKSIDDLGKWDQCRDLGHDVSHYCLVRFAIPVSIPTPYLGSCIPAKCTPAAMQDIVRKEITFLNETVGPMRNFSRLFDMYAALIRYQNETGLYQYECIGDTQKMGASPGAVVMVTISFVIVAFILIGTALDGYDSHWWPEKEPANPAVGSIQDEGELKPLVQPQPKRRSKLFAFLVAFSLVRNFKSMIGPSPPALAFLNGMRAISIMWVIFGHSLDYMNYAGVVNFAHVITKDVQKASAQAFPAAEFSVDSFFWLSGFLITWLTLTELRTKKRVNWFLYYFHRVWRLSPAYFYALFFYIYISVHLGEGPLWPKYVSQVDGTCGKYWWANLIYVNNFVPHNWNGQCFLWGWYLAVDFQLYIIAPIILVLYHKNKLAGWALVVGMTIGTTVINGVYAHTNHLVWNSQDPHVYMTEVYGKPYTRAAPWLLGIAVAFLYMEKKQLKRIVVYIGWAISGTIMLLCVYGPVSEFSDSDNPLKPPKNKWNSGDNFMYFTFSKLGWSLALSFIMYTMSMGWGGIVRRFLGAPFWSVLARLTYSTYLFHPIIMFTIYYSSLQYYSYDNYGFSIIYVGEVFLAFCVAGVMFLAVERPMVNMEKLFMHKKH